MALPDHERAPVFTPAERAALRYADAMTVTPVVVPDDVFAALRGHFDEPGIVEITATIAWENYRARFDHALEVPAEGWSEGAFCPGPAVATR